MSDDSLRTVTVAAGSRLHFGMFSFGQPHVRQFGGVGAMIDSPGLRLSIAPAAQFNVVGPLAERVCRTSTAIYARLRPELVRQADQNPGKICSALTGDAMGTPTGLGPLNNALGDSPACTITVEQAPREHTGLGVGTQLGLSIGAGLRAFFGLSPWSAPELARLAGRGERSAVGTYGFEHGGLIVEAGRSHDKLPPFGQPIAVGNKPSPATGSADSPLVSRVPLPEAWRFVLFIRREGSGLSGEAERRAFATLPPVPLTTTERLTRLAILNLLPAAIGHDFARFGAALYEYGVLAGECFAPQQHGAFANPQTAALVAQLQHFGVNGVGQTSWGPTVFALVESREAAVDLIHRLHEFISEPLILDQYEIVIASAANHGAVIRRS